MGKLRRALKSSEIRPIAEELIRQAGITEPPVPVDLIARSLGAVVRYSPFKGELGRYADSGRRWRGSGDRCELNSPCEPAAVHHRARMRAPATSRRKACVRRSIVPDKPSRRGLSSQATDIEEIEANRFAAELLLPFEMIRTDLMDYRPDIEDETELRALAEKYSVSLQALTLAYPKRCPGCSSILITIGDSAMEVVPVLRFGQPARLARRFARLAAGRFRAVTLVPHVGRVQAEQTAGQFRHLRRLRFVIGWDPPAADDAVTGAGIRKFDEDAPKKTKETFIGSFWKKTPPKKTAVSHRWIDYTFRSVLTTSRDTLPRARFYP